MRPLPFRGASSRAHSRSHWYAWSRRQGITEHFSYCPPSVGSSRRQSFGTLPGALRQKLTTSLSWLNERHPQRGMGAHKMGGGSPPFQVGQELWGGLGCGPAATCQSCHPMTDRQLHPFKTCGVQPPREAYPRPRSLEICLCPQAHQCVTCTCLRRQELCFTWPYMRPAATCRLSCFPPLARHLEPLSNMGWKGRKVHVSPIAGEEREAAGSQELSQGVDDSVRHMLGAGTQLEHRKNRA